MHTQEYTERAYKESVNEEIDKIQYTPTVKPNVTYIIRNKSYVKQEEWD